MAKKFTISFLASYLLVTALGLLLTVRPWEEGSELWIHQHNGIFVAYFIYNQIPGGIPLAFSFVFDIFEGLALAGAVILLIFTWRESKGRNSSARMRTLGNWTFALVAVTAIYRFFIMGVFAPFGPKVENHFDLRDSMTGWAWVNFESTLLLTLVLMHLWIRFSPRKSDK